MEEETGLGRGKSLTDTGLTQCWPTCWDILEPLPVRGTPSQGGVYIPYFAQWLEEGCPRKGMPLVRLFSVAEADSEAVS